MVASKNLGHHADSFYVQDIDGHTLLELTKEDFVEMGITLILGMKKKIQKLKEVKNTGMKSFSDGL